MTALIEKRSKLAALAATVVLVGVAILYAVWRDANRADYTVDTATYLKDVSAPPQTIDATIPSSPPFMLRSSIVESVGFGPLPRAALPTDQNDPPSAAIAWSAPPLVIALPEIQSPPDLKNLTGLDKLPSLSEVVPSISFSLPASPEPSGITFRPILPGVTQLETIGSPANAPAAISGGAIGAATGLLKR